MHLWRVLLPACGREHTVSLHEGLSTIAPVGFQTQWRLDRWSIKLL